MRLALLRAAHPEPGAAVTAVTALLTVGAGLPLGAAVAATGTVAASQLAVGWSNDAIDAARDGAVRRPDKPIAVGAVRRRTVVVAAVVAGLACVTLAFVTDVRAAPVAVVAFVSALSYNWPLKSTVVSPLPYAVSFSCLPAFVVLAAGRSVPVWLIAAGALLGAGAHFANVVPDLADDAATGVHGLPHRLGATGSLVTAAGLLLAVTALLVFGPPGPPRALGLVAGLVAVATLAVCGYRLRRFAFRAVLLVALLDVILLVAGGALG
jgi:protoheme IX farnesyltransferase